MIEGGCGWGRGLRAGMPVPSMSAGTHEWCPPTEPAREWGAQHPAVFLPGITHHPIRPSLVPFDENVVHGVLGSLHADAEEHLQAGARYEVRAQATDWGGGARLCWYRDLGMDAEESESWWALPPGGIVRETDRYIVIARCEAQSRRVCVEPSSLRDTRWCWPDLAPVEGKDARVGRCARRVASMRMQRGFSAHKPRQLYDRG